MRINASWFACVVLALSFAAGTAAAQAPAQAPPPALVLVDIRDLPLDEALRILADQTGLNLVASTDAAKVRVSLHLRDVDPMAAVDTLAKTHNLFYKRDEASGIIRLHTVSEYQRELSTFREEKTEVFTLLYPNAIDVATAIRDLYGDRVQLSFGADGEDELNDLQDRFDRFDLINARSQGLGLFPGEGGTNGGTQIRP